MSGATWYAPRTGGGSGARGRAGSGAATRVPTVTRETCDGEHTGWGVIVS